MGALWVAAAIFFKRAAHMTSKSSGDCDREAPPTISFFFFCEMRVCAFRLHQQKRPTNQAAFARRQTAPTCAACSVDHNNDNRRRSRLIRKNFCMLQFFWFVVADARCHKCEQRATDKNKRLRVYRANSLASTRRGRDATVCFKQFFGRFADTYNRIYRCFLISTASHK